MEKCFLPLLYELGVINATQEYILLEWLTFLNRTMKVQFDGIIYLRTEPEIALQRIQQRKRLGEEKINIEYLSKLHGYYENLLQNEKTIPVYQINGNQSKDQMVNELSKIFKTL